MVHAKDGRWVLWLYGVPSETTTCYFTVAASYENAGLFFDNNILDV